MRTEELEDEEEEEKERVVKDVKLRRRPSQTEAVYSTPAVRRRR